MGKYRTGKSYFINKVILDQDQAFPTGNTIQPCTKGLWIYKEMLNHKEKNIIVLDTEGLGALDVNKKSDSR